MRTASLRKVWYRVPTTVDTFKARLFQAAGNLPRRSVPLESGGSVQVQWRVDELRRAPDDPNFPGLQPQLNANVRPVTKTMLEIPVLYTYSAPIVTDGKSRYASGAFVSKEEYFAERKAAGVAAQVLTEDFTPRNYAGIVEGIRFTITATLSREIRKVLAECSLQELGDVFQQLVFEMDEAISGGDWPEMARHANQAGESNTYFSPGAERDNAIRAAVLLGKSDREIGDELGLDRSTITSRRNELGITPAWGRGHSPRRKKRS